MGTSAVVLGVDDNGTDDAIAQRLRDLGFVAGEPVRIAARGPLGADPLLVQIGYTRFALRRAEAARVRIAIGAQFIAPDVPASSDARGRDESRPYDAGAKP